MNKEKVKIIDCTFRDGGYYNNWNFDPELVNEYLAAMDDMSIEFVELGFRSFDKVGFKGAFAFTSDEFVLSLNAPTGLKLGVMVNAAELIAYPGGVIAAIEKLFKAKKHSPISLVRIACHFHEFEDALPSVEWLKKQGYFVGIKLSIGCAVFC